MPTIAEIREAAKRTQYQLLYNNLKNLEAGLHRTAIEWEEEPPPEPEECAGGVIAGDGETREEDKLGDESQEGQDSDTSDDEGKDQSHGSANDAQSGTEDTTQQDAGCADDSQNQPGDGDGEQQGRGDKSKTVGELNERRKEQGQSSKGRSEGKPASGSTEVPEDDEEDTGKRAKFDGYGESVNADELHGHNKHHKGQERQEIKGLRHLVGMPERFERIDRYGNTVHVYEVFCTCGWVSNSYRSEAAATSEAYRHLTQKAQFKD